MWKSLHGLAGGVWRDVRYGLRVLGRSPRSTITALTLLVLAIGSTTAISSISYAVLVRPLPYRHADRLVFLAEKDSLGIAWPNFEDWRRRATSFEGLAGSLADAVIATDGPIPRRHESRSVTSNFFQVLGVAPFRGRLFDQSDIRPEAGAVAVVSHAFWTRELGGDADAIGRTLSLNRRTYAVIGVLPPGFRYLTPADVYLLLEPQVAANYRGMLNRRTHTTFYGIGRLKPAVSLPAARTEMRTIAGALALEYPDTNKGSYVNVVALGDHIVGGMAPMLTVVTGAVALLLIVACVNLAGLLLNTSAARAHELRIRAAIGATRWSVIRQLLVEQALLVGAGSVLGAIAGAAMLTGLVAAAPRTMPRLDEIRLDFVVLSTTTAVCCACAFLFGVLPAFSASGVTGHALVIRSGSGPTRPGSFLRRCLMSAEIALATVLLFGSALMVHTMTRLARVDPGFDPHNLQTFMFSLTGPAWPDAKKQVFYDVVVDRLRAVAGVENAAITYALPILGSNWWNVFTIAGTTAAHRESVGEFPNAAMVPVTANYFETLRIPLIAGRYFDRTDTPGSMPVAIVNRTLAEKYWPDADPMGKQIRQGRPAEPYGPWRTIVGVVGDVRQHGVDQEMPPQIFMPIVQQPRTTVFAVVRTGARLDSAIEAAFHELDRTIPVFNERTVSQVMSEASSRRRIAMIVLTVFGGVAVLLTAIGLYGVIAHNVSERRREIGVRVALGATGGQVSRLFLRHGLVAVAAGIACGIPAAMAASRTLATLVFGITARDPATLAIVAATIATVALLACYIPARSATRVDPWSALRSE